MNRRTFIQVLLGLFTAPVAALSRDKAEWTFKKPSEFATGGEKAQGYVDIYVDEFPWMTDYEDAKAEKGAA